MTNSENVVFPTTAITALMQQILKRLLIATGGLTVATILIGALISGMAGVWSGVLAGVLGLIFTATTVVLLKWMVGRDPQLMAAVVLGGWLIKMIVLGGAVFYLRTQDFYNKYVFGAGIIVIALVCLVLEVHAVLTAQIPRVEPGAGGHE